MTTPAYRGKVTGRVEPDHLGRWVVTIKIGRDVVDRQAFHTPGGARRWCDDRVAYLRKFVRQS